MSRPKPLGQPLDDTDRARVRKLVEQRGEREAAVLLGVADRTLMRCMAGLGVYPGTRAIVKQSLDRLSQGSIA
ncbi:MAG TPA: hypothetical protein VHC69_31575 [Polyangiaceae bacterium]|nr:hypothetical protein [Polyangiaceae bacterium]